MGEDAHGAPALSPKYGSRRRGSEERVDPAEVASMVARSGGRAERLETAGR